MKSTLKFLFLTFSLIIVSFSCSSDDDVNSNYCTNCPPENFEAITRLHIANNEANLSSNEIIGTNASGSGLKPGDVVVYKTNEGRFGKLEVLNINIAENFKLTIKAITFKSDGTIYSQTGFSEIHGTYSFDLDLLVSNEIFENIDFWWERIEVFETDLLPVNEAKFYKYPL